MPDPVPVVLSGQLASDEACRGHRPDSDLMVDAARRSLAATGVVGARVVVQAVDERARTFCKMVWLSSAFRS